MIWVLSEVDRLIDTATFTEQDKMDIAHFQTGPRAHDCKVEEPGDKVYPCAMGVGHDDGNLQRTYFELETLLSKGGGQLHSSDATGWDLSVSSTTFYGNEIVQVHERSPNCYLPRERLCCLRFSSEHGDYPLGVMPFWHCGIRFADHDVRQFTRPTGWQ